MRFRFRCLPELPVLSWCAALHAHEEDVVVRHGSGVEVADRFFVEGIWNAKFGEGRFDTATAFLGSGARLLDTGVEFCTPSHPLERLQSIRDGDVLHVSNSLVALLAILGDRPDPRYRLYDSDFGSILSGLKRAVTSVPTAAGHRARLHYCMRLVIRHDLEMRSSGREYERPFRDFTDYFARQQAMVEGLVENACDSARRVSYEPLTTISSGYDSGATSVFACETGCSHALTFRSARENFGVADDSGDEVARVLGLTVREFDREAYLSGEEFPEAEFLAVGSGGEDVIMSAFEPVLSRRLLFTGFRGDTVWACTGPDASACANFVQSDASGNSLTEFRLRTGFVHVPLPVLTFTGTPSLRQIANSAEMKPWSIGGAPARGLSERWRRLRGKSGKAYDRPIPRRILEERGVPRRAFGQRKAAVTQPFYHGGSLSELLSPHSSDDFTDWLAQNSEHRLDAEALRVWCCSIAYRLTYYASKASDVLSNLIGRTWKLPVVISARYQVRLSDRSYLFHWAVERTLPRYVALAGRAGRDAAPPGRISEERAAR